MRKAGIFVDSSNLYYCLQKKYGRKLDYEKYKNYFSSLYSIEQCFAYAAVNGNASLGFLKAVEKVGYEVKTKEVKVYDGGNKRKCDMDVDMTIDIMNMCDKLDVIILGTADGDMSPLVDCLRGRSKKVICFACGISGELVKRCDQAMEIVTEVLE